MSLIKSIFYIPANTAGFVGAKLFPLKSKVNDKGVISATGINYSRKAFEEMGTIRKAVSVAAVILTGVVAGAFMYGAIGAGIGMFAITYCGASPLILSPSLIYGALWGAAQGALLGAIALPRSNVYVAKILQSMHLA